MSVGVVIPALNESPTIGAVIARVQAAVPGAGIVVVDDASSDDTGTIARSAGAMVICHAAPRGYSSALRAGFVAALAGGAEIVVQLDADGQHSPEEVPRLLDLLTGYDVAIGSRFGAGGYPMSWSRRGAIATCSALARLGGVRVSDPTSGFRGLRRPVAELVAHRGFPHGLTESSFLVWAHRQGFRIGEVPVTMHASEDRSMHSGPAAAWHFARIVRATLALAVARPPR
jgi:glycosyltransferase involved in cell wall biosynthesis